MHSRLPKLRSFVILSGVWLSAGCGSSTSEAPANPKGQVVTGHAQAPPGAFDKAAFECCSDPQAKAVVGAFSALGASLAADDEAGARKGAGDLAVALEAAAPLFTGEAGALSGASGAFRSAGDISAVRDAYLAASIPMLALAKAHKGGDQAFAIAYCPMKPGRWLQTAAELANPYYGAEMLRCGTFEGLE